MPGRRVSVWWECFCRIVGERGEKSLKVGGEAPHTPPFLLFFFFPLFRVSVQDQKIEEEKRPSGVQDHDTHTHS